MKMKKESLGCSKVVNWGLAEAWGGGWTKGQTLGDLNMVICLFLSDQGRAEVTLRRLFGKEEFRFPCLGSKGNSWKWG